jgi:hypothetical protein
MTEQQLIYAGITVLATLGGILAVALGSIKDRVDALEDHAGRRCKRCKGKYTGPRGKGFCMGCDDPAAGLRTAAQVNRDGR